MQRTDDELIRACRGGDESAWDELVHKYQNLLFSIPRRAGLGRDLASDVIQDVFTTLYVKLDTLEKPEFLRAWMMTTARHKTIQLIQRETRGRPVSIDDDESDSVALQIPDDEPLADAQLVRLEAELQLEKAMAKLEDRCRRLLTMLYLSDDAYSYADISAHLEIPIGGIGPTRARCLQKLLKLIR